MGRVSGLGHPEGNAGTTRLQHAERRSKGGAAERVASKAVISLRQVGYGSTG
jgi:hypothetical protein